MIDEEIKIVGVARSDDNNEVLYVASDPKASYSLVADPDKGACEWVDSSKIDYNYLPPTKHATLRNTVVEHTGLPLSYLQIDSVEQGTEWYKANSRYPDLVCEMMAKYEWGDLRYKTKKEFKNMKKKRERKGHAPILGVRKGPIVVNFAK